MKNPVHLTVAVCLALLSPQSVEANHETVGLMEFAENGLYIGRAVDYSLISLSVNASAPNDLRFNTGVATWLNQPGAIFEDTASQQGFTLIDENMPITLPIPNPGILRGFYLGDLLPHVFNDLSFLNEHVTVRYQVVGTSDVQVGGFVPAVIPEPSSVVLVGLACSALPGFVRRPKHSRI